MDRDGRDTRAGAALELQWFENQCEFVDASRGNFIELHVFEQMNAVDDQHDLVDRTGELEIGIRGDLNRRVVGTHQHRVLASEPFRGGYADAGSSRPE